MGRRGFRGGLGHDPFQAVIAVPRPSPNVPGGGAAGRTARSAGGLCTVAVQDPPADLPLASEGVTARHLGSGPRLPVSSRAPTAVSSYRRAIETTGHWSTRPAGRDRRIGRGSCTSAGPYPDHDPQDARLSAPSARTSSINRLGPGGRRRCSRIATGPPGSAGARAARTAGGPAAPRRPNFMIAHEGRGRKGGRVIFYGAWCINNRPPIAMPRCKEHR